MASSSSEPLSPKSKVERFLAACWFNLLMKDDQLKQKETVGGRISGLKKIKRNIDRSDDKQLERTEQAQKRGRPISNLDWLPHGWERITKRRSSGQNDTIESSRTMRSSYDVTSYLEFGKVIKKNKERVKPILEAKYGLKFPKERRREIALMGAWEDSVLSLPCPPGSVAETPAS
ncbi:hypothetical protein KFK09_001046 [Dendrobium nobile]|uniref:Uncharacterized protein n=1 Tax=Dendrobium nobile TaxID=94219 RepID=A0A8T3CGP7_DENNO|nr:hypothetical protein KFK09_001046 [Dendrobium nobile]